MFRFARAGGFAVASLFVALSATYAGPSLAEELAPVPATASYFQHSSAAPVQVTPAPAADQAIATPSYDPNLTQGVVEHAVAPLEITTAVSASRSLADLVGDYASADVPDAEFECLAGTVYFESKGEPLQGQLAVAEVVLNRAASGKYPKSICGVVKQKSQFSFIRGGRMPVIAKSSPAWRKAVAIAHIAKRELADGGVEDALFFHARYVSPSWRNRKRVASIGNHIFYR